MTREDAMKVAKPILFNTEMVFALSNRKKTETRRVAKPQPPKDAKGTFERMDNGNFQLKVAPYEGIYDYEIKPQYQVGNILYVRETWCDPSGTGYPILYKADMPMHWDTEDTDIDEPVDLKAEDYKWRPSIHMPKEVARIFLRVTNVRVERLQDMTDEDCAKDGGFSIYAIQAVGKERLFGGLWNSTIKKSDLDKYGWAANPRVTVTEFERLEVEAL